MQINFFRFQNITSKLPLLCKIKFSNYCTLSENQPEKEFTHFGFKSVEKNKKAKLVEEVFHNSSKNYDLMNDIMSLGIHRYWKDEFIKLLSPNENMKLIDVAGGTGDIAFRFIESMRKIEENNSIPKGFILQNSKQMKSSSSVTVVDINKSMLEVGKKRAIDKNYINIENRNIYPISIPIEFKQGDAENLPFSDNSYDAYTIAFGIRNCTNIDKVVKEAYRILKPGGRFLCLEFSQVEGSKILQNIYDEYSFNVIPPLGYLFSNDWNSYQYLVESIRQFPSQLQFKEIIENQGFSHVSYINYTFGIVSIHSGFKL